MVIHTLIYLLIFGDWFTFLFIWIKEVVDLAKEAAIHIEVKLFTIWRREFFAFMLGSIQVEAIFVVANLALA